MKNLLLIPLTFLLLSCEQRKSEPLAQLQVSKDDFGHIVQLKQTPCRIVSLAPSITETLFALSLDSSIVGVTDYCDVPSIAKLKPKVGGMLNPNIERIIELKPDLVLMSASGNMQTDYQKLTSLGIPVFVSNPRTIDGVLKSIRDIGELTQQKATAETLAAKLRNRRSKIIEELRTKPSQKVLLLLSLNPLIAAGKGTFLDELITAARGENIARGAGISYPVLSREEIFRSKPDVIIATSDIVKARDAIAAAYPEWRELPAIQNKRIAIVDASLVSRPGPRIVEGLEVVARMIHGEW
jgi:iron complex transport system substrate-binding protein